MNIRSSLSDKAAIIVTGNLLNAVLGMAGGLILVRVLVQRDYGTYAQAFLIFSTLSSVFLVGLPESIYYFVPQYSTNKKKAFIFQTYVLAVSFGLIFGVFLIIGRKWVGTAFDNPNLSSILLPFSFFVALSLPVALLRPILISMERHRAAAAGGILSDMSVLATIVTTALMHFSVYKIFCAIAIVAGLRLSLMLGYIVCIFSGIKIEWQGKLLKEQFAYSGPLAFSTVLGIFTGRVDSIVISSVYPPEKYAIYNVGAREVPFVDIITYSVGSVLLSHLVVHYAEKRYAEFISLWHESIRKVALIMLPLFAFLLVYARPFITVLFTERYTASVAPFVIFLFLLPLRVTAYGNIVRAMGLTKPLVLGAVITGISTIILNLSLIRLVGFIGPAIATVLTNYLLAGYYLYLGGRQLKMPFSKIMPWPILAKIGVLAAISGLAASIPLLLITEAWKQLIVGLIVFGIFFIILGRFLNFIRQEDIALLKRWLSLRPLFGV